MKLKSIAILTGVALTLSLGAVAAPKTNFSGSGTFKVGSQVAAGIYVSATKTTSSCYWSRLADFSGSFDSILANEFGKGQQVVEILETDAGIKVSRCAKFNKLGTLKALKSIPSEGVYVVGQQIAPGLYVSDTKINKTCYWSRLGDFQGSLDSILANELGKGQQILEVLEGDVGVKVSGCATFNKLGTLKPLANIPAEGVYLVGQQIAPGTYQSTATSGSCYWARLSNFNDSIDSIIANDYTDGQQIVTIEASDLGFKTSGCGTWTKVQG